MWQAFFVVFYCEEKYMNNPEHGLYENSVKKARAEMAYDKNRSLNSGRKIFFMITSDMQENFWFRKSGA